MAPKTPSELKEQVEEKNAGRPDDDHSMTADRVKVPNPSREDFLSNLEKVSKPDRS